MGHNHIVNVGPIPSADYSETDLYLSPYYLQKKRDKTLDRKTEQRK